MGRAVSVDIGQTTARPGQRNAAESCAKKVRYEAEVSARHAAHEHLRRSHKDDVLLNAYPCALCRGWHLTSNVSKFSVPVTSQGSGNFRTGNLGRVVRKPRPRVEG